jgi:hypothetical protein
MKAILQVSSIIVLIIYALSIIAPGKIDASEMIRICSAQDLLIDRIFEKAFSQRLSACDLVNFSNQELRIIRNSIYAKNGRSFNSKDLRLYFENKAWYEVDPNFHENLLSSIHKENLVLLKTIEDLKKIRKKKSKKSQHIHGHRVNDIEMNLPGLGDEYRSEFIHPNFTKFSEFLIPLDETALSLAEAKKKYGQKLKFLGKGPMSPPHYLKEKDRNSDGKITAEDAIGFIDGATFIPLPQNRGFLIAYVCTVRASPVAEYFAEVFSPTGEFRAQLSYFPHYVLKNNYDLIVTPVFSGCCGTWGYDFAFHNLSSGKEISISCSANSCKDALLTWIEDCNKILMIYSIERNHSNGTEKELNMCLIDEDGNLSTQASFDKTILIDHPQLIVDNLVGVRETMSDSQWVFKFVDKQEIYIELSK